MRKNGPISATIYQSVTPIAHRSPGADLRIKLAHKKDRRLIRNPSKGSSAAPFPFSADGLRHGLCYWAANPVALAVIPPVASPTGWSAPFEVTRNELRVPFPFARENRNLPSRLTAMSTGWLPTQMTATECLIPRHWTKKFHRNRVFK